ncbi:MAG: hypothetical protein K8T26_01480 [Lentisphaerae bacterium]|nr:hypothetical protein [Lentisphaerota bacterium]
MKKRDHQEEQEAAFVLGASDVFHSIFCSQPVLFADQAKAEIILTFFVIRRGNDTFTISNVNRTYDAKGKCVTRSVQNKDGIPASRIEQEIQAIKVAFARSIEAGSGRKLKWDSLDLTTVTTMKEQVERIHAFGRVAVRVASDIPPISVN